VSVDGFQVDSERLVEHARRLGFVSEAIGLAAGAAAQVDLHDGAFGLLCAFLPPFVNGAEVSTGDAIGAARETVDATIDGVLAMAGDYASVDDGVGSRLGKMIGGGVR
jgi:hypothetical protein